MGIVSFLLYPVSPDFSELFKKGKIHDTRLENLLDRNYSRLSKATRQQDRFQLKFARPGPVFTMF